MPIDDADIAAISTPEEGRAVALSLIKEREVLDIALDEAVWSMRGDSNRKLSPAEKYGWRKMFVRRGEILVFGDFTNEP